VTGPIIDTTGADVDPSVLSVSAIEPSLGPTAGLIQTELRGTRLGDVTAVYFGAVPAVDVFAVNDGLVVFLTPPHEPGLVDVRVETRDPETPILTIPAAYLFRDPMQVTAVSPALDHPMGGARVTVSGDGFDASTRVIFGRRRALAVEVRDARSLSCVVPPGEVGTVDVFVAGDNGSARLRNGFTYEGEPLPRLEGTITEVSPNRGPASGGTNVTIRGRGFRSGMSVRIGALAATQVNVSSDGWSITLRTPPGSPGPNDVHVLQSGAALTVKDGFSYETASPELYVARPARGATAGGTRVRIIGAGLPTSGRPAVQVGQGAARDVSLGDGTWLEFNTPAGTLGGADITVTVNGGAPVASLPNGFTYFDPASRPGTWGEPIDENVNVSVVDARSGDPLDAAFVMLGAASNNTPYRGYTNAAGQLVFSGAGLKGAQSVTASKAGYQTVNLAGFNAENVTIGLERAPTCEDVADMPCDSISPPPITAYFEGHIIGSSKGPSLPFGRCGDWGDHKDGWCAPCTAASSCGDVTSGSVCLPLGDEGSFCSITCTSNDECGGSFVCLDPTGRDEVRRCVPPPGTPAVFCDVTEPSISDSTSMQFPGKQVLADNTVRFETRLGQYAVFCWGGSLIRGSFRPDRLGVARGLTAEVDGTIVRADIRLDIPLSQQVTMVLDRPTLGRNTGFLDGDRPMLRTFLDLNGDGLLEFPPLRALTVRSFRQSIPSALTASLSDATWTLVGGVESPSINGGSMLVERRIKTLAAAFDYRLEDDVWEALPTALDGTTDACTWPTPSGQPAVLAVGDGGRIARRVGNTWSRMNGDGAGNLRAVAAAPVVGVTGYAAAIAGGDGGVMLHWDGFRWLATDSGTDDVVTDLVFEDGTVAWATAGDSLLRWDGAVWEAVFTAPMPLAAIAIAPDGTKVAVGAGGVFVSGDLNAFTTSQLPTDVSLKSVAVGLDGIIDVVGAEGAWLIKDGDAPWMQLQVPANRDLMVVRRDLDGLDGDALVGGADGALWVRRGTDVVIKDPKVSRGTIRAIALSDRGILALGTHERVVGPLMGIPEDLQPGAGGSLSAGLSWTAREGLTPHFNLIDFESAVGPCSACGFLFMLPFTEWRTIAEGGLFRADFPNLDGIPGALPMSRGLKSIAIYRVRVDEGFDFNDTASTGFFGADWRAWAWRYTAVIR